MANELQNTSNGTPIAPWIIFGLCILYDISPVDIIPDIPVIGWIDDFFITATGTLNLIQKTCNDSMAWLGTIAKYLKWIVALIGILIIALVGRLVMLGIQLFT